MRGCLLTSLPAPGVFGGIGLLRWYGCDNKGVRSCVPQEMWGKDCPDLNLEWDIPFRELGFSGVPHRCAAHSGTEGLVQFFGCCYRSSTLRVLY